MDHTDSILYRIYQAKKIASGISDIVDQAKTKGSELLDTLKEKRQEAGDALSSSADNVLSKGQDVIKNLNPEEKLNSAIAGVSKAKESISDAAKNKLIMRLLGGGLIGGTASGLMTDTSNKHETAAAKRKRVIFNALTGAAGGAGLAGVAGYGLAPADDSVSKTKMLSSLENLMADAKNKIVS